MIIFQTSNPLSLCNEACREKEKNFCAFLPLVKILQGVISSFNEKFSIKYCKSFRNDRSLASDTKEGTERHTCECTHAHTLIMCERCEAKEWVIMKLYVFNCSVIEFKASWPSDTFIKSAGPQIYMMMPIPKVILLSTHRAWLPGEKGRQ